MNQPAKLYPARVGEAGAEMFEPVTVVVARIVEPPFELNVTSRVFADHFA